MLSRRFTLLSKRRMRSNTIFLSRFFLTSTRFFSSSYCFYSVNDIIHKTISGGKDPTRKRIEQMEVEREERRKEIIQRKQSRKAESAKLLAAGNPGDVDFIGMVEQWRLEQANKQMKSNQKSLENQRANSNIIVAVRKRPMSEKEIKTLVKQNNFNIYPPIRRVKTRSTR